MMHFVKTKLKQTNHVGGGGNLVQLCITVTIETMYNNIYRLSKIILVLYLRVSDVK